MVKRSRDLFHSTSQTILRRKFASVRDHMGRVSASTLKLEDTSKTPSTAFPVSSRTPNTNVIRGQSDSTSIAVGANSSKKERDARVWDAIEEGQHTARQNGDIIIFTDGGALHNPGFAGMGITIEIPLLKYTPPPARASDASEPVGAFTVSKPIIHALRQDVAMSVGSATNNHCEINAIKHALLILSNIDELVSSDQPIPLHSRHVRLHSDSLLCIKLLTNEWKAKEMKTAVAEIRQTILDYQAKFQCNIEFIWVKGHGASHENERADTLATIGQLASQTENITTTLDTPLMCEEGSGVHPITYVMEKSRLKPLIIK